ncbi:NAD(P)-dependent oxidoreductase [Nonomuraea gerenzanensis]|uniref:NAD(P)-dependent oxidoreductase n=1 Tax=Nonomuraea gerenzanensis TaxID=93944 RepID=UPI001CD9E9E6|nr:NAD(P)-dependent oxidoreductase [Nonomuraea gerenzanensis]UBU18369.1 hypothetical protein LCN96_26110 [Nonomuraea gerenzanensis]
MLITTDYLRPGDEVDGFLRRSGLETAHLPMLGRRDPEQLVAALAGIDAALVANEPLTAGVLARAPRLRVIVRTGVGFDSIDVAAATRLGISVSNLPGINANAVAEYTMGLLLAGARRLVQTAHGVAQGAWPGADGHELRGSVLGLIGYGASARAVVPLARAFGMSVLCTTSVPARLRGDSSVKFVEQAFKLMKPATLLVNTARGAVVDEAALVAAVRAGEIAGAALDVVREEPLPPDSPLRGVDGIVVYSHLAGQTAEARAAAGREGAEELVAALEGRPRFPVS